MNPLYTAIIGSVVRAILTAISGYLISKKILTAQQGESAVAMIGSQILNSLPGLAALAWSFFQKHASRSKLMTSLMLGEVTEDAVKAHLESGAPKPTVFTPPETVPSVPLPTTKDADLH